MAMTPPVKPIRSEVDWSERMVGGGLNATRR